MEKSQKTKTNMTTEEIINEIIKQSNRMALDDLASSGKAIEGCGIICAPRLKANLDYGFYKNGIDIPIIPNPCIESNKFYIVTDTELVNKMKEMVRNDYVWPWS